MLIVEFNIHYTEWDKTEDLLNNLKKNNLITSPDLGQLTQLTSKDSPSPWD